MIQRKESSIAALKKKLKKLEQKYEQLNENATIVRDKLMKAYEKTESKLKTMEK